MKTLLLLLLSITQAFAAVAPTTIFEFNPNSTSSMVNGGGFNTANANFPTDGAWASANTNSPTLTSASYSFIAGDVGSWVYSSNTTNPGFYKISSVSSGVATVNATIGTGVVLSTTTNRWGPSTIVGVDSSASPSSKTYGVDYSQTTTANSSVSDLASVGTTSVLTSASNPWTKVSVGNYIHITNSGTAAHCFIGWYEIVSESLISSITVDRTPNDGVTCAAATAQTGGSLDLAGILQTSFVTQVVGGNMIFVHSGTYLVGATTTGSGTGASATTPAYFIGYNSIRGDNPNTNSTRPLINGQATTTTLAQAQQLAYINFTSSGTTTVVTGANGSVQNCKFNNGSTTAARTALSLGGSSSADMIEAVSQNGIAVAQGSNCSINDAYIHDSATCLSIGSTGGQAISNSILASCALGANATNGNSALNAVGNTFYSAEASTNTAIVIINSGTKFFFRNNIFYGWNQGVTQATAQQGANLGFCNDFFNNTTNALNYTLAQSDLSLNPQFVSAGQLTGTTATSATNVLTDSAANFNGNVTDSVDYLHIASGTGATTGNYLIISHTNTTLTVNNTIGTSSGGNLVYFVPNKHNYAVGTNMKATACPGLFPGGLTQSYLDIGGVQRQEPTSGGGTGFFIP